MDLEQKMVQKEVVEFKIDDSYTARFVVDKKFLNNKVTSLIAEYMLCVSYMNENNIVTMDCLVDVLFVKYFVKQLDKKGKKEVEVDTITTGGTVEDNFNLLIATASAMINIENTDGVNFLEFIVSKFLENESEMEKVKQKLDTFSKNFDDKKEQINDMISEFVERNSLIEK